MRTTKLHEIDTGQLVRVMGGCKPRMQMAAASYAYQQAAPSDPSVDVTVGSGAAVGQMFQQALQGGTATA